MKKNGAIAHPLLQICTETSQMSSSNSTAGRDCYITVKSAAAPDLDAVKMKLPIIRSEKLPQSGYWSGKRINSLLRKVLFPKSEALSKEAVMRN